MCVGVRLEDNLRKLDFYTEERREVRMVVVDERVEVVEEVEGED